MVRKLNLNETLSIVTKYVQQDIESNLVDYQILIEAFIALQEHLVNSNIEIPEWKTSLDPLTTKAILHASTIKTLISGYTLPNPIDNKILKIIDIPSIYVIIRSQLENLLIIEYIYCNSTTNKEKEFRHDCWLYSGLLARAKKTAISESIKTQQIKDAEQIKLLREKIDNTSFFHKQLSRDKRKQFLKYGHARLYKSWSTLATESRLNDIIFNNLYPILSNHTHSEALGAINLRKKKLGYHKNHSEGFLMLFLSQIILSLAIKSFCTTFKILEVKYNMLNENTRSLIDQSEILGRNYR